MDTAVRLAITVNLEGSKIDPPSRLIDHLYPLALNLASPTSGRWLTYGTNLKKDEFPSVFSLHPLSMASTFALSQNIPGSPFGGI